MPRYSPEQANCRTLPNSLSPTGSDSTPGLALRFEETAQGTQVLCDQLRQLQQDHDAAQEDNAVLRAKVAEQAKFKEMNAILATPDTEVNAVRIEMMQVRDREKAECNAWKVKHEVLLAGHANLVREVEGEKGLRSSHAMLTAENAALQFHKTENPRLKAENIRCQAEILMLRKELRAANLDLDGAKEAAAVEAALRAKHTVLERRYTLLSEQVEGSGGLRAEVERQKDLNSTLKARNEELLVVNTDTDALNKQVTRITVEAARLAKEKQALVELNHKQAEALERRREEQQLLRAELAVIKGDAEAMACAPPTYVGLNGQGVYLSHNSGENTSKLASGRAMVPTTENSVPSNTAASGESWFERQYNWNKMKIGR